MLIFFSGDTVRLKYAVLFVVLNFKFAHVYTKKGPKIIF